MTSVLYEPGEYRLNVKGHAKAGKDIDPVCAGVSALAWALVSAASDREDYGASLLINEKIPEIDVRCNPTDKAKKPCRYMFEIIVGGLLLIAEAHPEHLQIKIGG